MSGNVPMSQSSGHDRCGWDAGRRTVSGEHRAADDERAIRDLMERHGTHRDVARLVLPRLSDREADFVLWELTPFPLVQGVALMPYLRKAAMGLKRPRSRLVTRRKQRRAW